MRFKRESQFAPVSVPCFDFKGGEDYELSKKTVIIAPVRIVECQDGSIQVSWACNRGAYCKDKHCRYSHAAEQHEQGLK